MNRTQAQSNTIRNGHTAVANGHSDNRTQCQLDTVAFGHNKNGPTVVAIGHNKKWTHGGCKRTQCRSDTVENRHTMVANGHMFDQTQFHMGL
ncbi:hypothetical protein RF55_16258 [Lasius niger]|uniref:Uncharacterized protein n=1 Tax=Lasius niger TaxID=67767 RepID=A0A0J7K4Q5_LASNI|nr:hypothetical protein RF55_16258 [Lasius niger]